MIRKLPSVKYLCECFVYERSTGKLYWKKRPVSHFPSITTAKIWNKRWAGKAAFHISKRGYQYGTLDGKYCAAHRVIWKLMTGKEPPSIIDHRDQNKNNNCWRNLRAATKPQNCVNRKWIIPPSGYHGVHKHRNKNRWVAQAGIRGKGRRYLGIFDSPRKAYAARRVAEKELYGTFVP